MKVEVEASLVEDDAASENEAYLEEDTGPLIVGRKVSLPPSLILDMDGLESSTEFVGGGV